MVRVYNKRGDVPAGAVYIGRPSLFGNPFLIGRDGDRDAVITKYAEYVDAHPEIKEAARKQLRGKNLVCWCAPLACHGDIMLRIANEQDSTEEQ